MEPLLYGAKDMRSHGRTLAAPVEERYWRCFSDQPAPTCFWLCVGHPSFKPGSEFYGPQEAPPTQAPPLPSESQSQPSSAATSRQILGTKGQSSRVALGIYPDTGPSLALELTEATDSGP